MVHSFIKIMKFRKVFSFTDASFFVTRQPLVVGNTQNSLDSWEMEREAYINLMQSWPTLPTHEATSPSPPPLLALVNTGKISPGNRGSSVRSGRAGESKGFGSIREAFQSHHFCPSLPKSPPIDCASLPPSHHTLPDPPTPIPPTP